MKTLKPQHIGKFFFWLSFLLGNICLFGYIISKNEDFAIAGYLLLIYGALVNGAVFLVLILYGVLAEKNSDKTISSAMLMLLNIPIAILYAWIGLSIH